MTMEKAEIQKSGFVVELEKSVWLLAADDDPSRTLVLANATRWPTARSAKRALSRVRKCCRHKFYGAMIYWHESERDQMKVECTESVDVTCTVDVEIEDVLAMLARRVSSDPTLRGIGPVLDWMTRLLASLPPEVIAEFPELAYSELQRRLTSIIDQFSAARALSLKSSEND